MKKVILALGILLIISAQASTVYAGSLNSYENEVVAEAKKIYEYNGVKYQVDPVFIDQLIAYLSSDDIDLTAEQKDEVLQMAFSNIEKGVKDGYLVPVQEQDNTQKESSNNDNAATDNTSDNTSDNTTDNTTGNTNTDTASNTADTNSSDTATTPSSNKNTALEGTDNAGSTNSDSSVADTDGSTIEPTDNSTSDVTPEEMINQVLNGGQNNTAGSDSSVGTENSAENNIIKNTGFNLNNTVAVIMGMGILMLIGIIVTMKSNYFAHNDE